MKVGELKANPKNPRKISADKLAQLAESMAEFGDLSGIVFNRKSGNTVGGTQRTKNLHESAEVVFTKEYKKPTRTGTVALGYILQEGERFAYREVSWGPKKETAATIAANKNAGEWDRDKLTELFRGLSGGIDFNLDLTMFDQYERAEFFPQKTPTKTDDGEDDGLDESPSKLIHECPSCGHKFR